MIRSPALEDEARRTVAARRARRHVRLDGGGIGGLMGRVDPEYLHRRAPRGNRAQTMGAPPGSRRHLGRHHAARHRGRDAVAGDPGWVWYPAARDAGAAIGTAIDEPWNEP